MGDLHYIKAAIYLKKEFDLDKDRNTFEYVWTLSFHGFIQEILCRGRVRFTATSGFLMTIRSRQAFRGWKRSSRGFLWIERSGGSRSYSGECWELGEGFSTMT